MSGNPSQALTRLRDWARRMAAGEEVRVPRPLDYDKAYSLTTPTTPKTVKRVATDSERVLWRQIADEIDAFIADESVEPIDGQLDLIPPATYDNGFLPNDDDRRTS